jgi:hypothetical protein
MKELIVEKRIDDYDNDDDTKKICGGDPPKHDEVWGTSFINYIHSRIFFIYIQRLPVPLLVRSRKGGSKKASDVFCRGMLFRFASFRCK